MNSNYLCKTPDISKNFYEYRSPIPSILEEKEESPPTDSNMRTPPSKKTKDFSLSNDSKGSLNEWLLNSSQKKISRAGNQNDISSISKSLMTDVKRLKILSIFAIVLEEKIKVHSLMYYKSAFENMKQMSHKISLTKFGFLKLFGVTSKKHKEFKKQVVSRFIELFGKKFKNYMKGIMNVKKPVTPTSKNQPKLSLLVSKMLKLTRDLINDQKAEDFKIPSKDLNILIVLQRGLNLLAFFYNYLRKKSLQVAFQTILKRTVQSIPEDDITGIKDFSHYSIILHPAPEEKSNKPKTKLLRTPNKHNRSHMDNILNFSQNHSPIPVHMLSQQIIRVGEVSSQDLSSYYESSINISPDKRIEKFHNKLKNLNFILNKKMPSMKSKHLHKFLQYDHALFQVFRISQNSRKREKLITFQIILNYAARKKAYMKTMNNLLNLAKRFQSNLILKCLMKWHKGEAFTHSIMVTETVSTVKKIDRVKTIKQFMRLFRNRMKFSWDKLVDFIEWNQILEKSKRRTIFLLNLAFLLPNLFNRRKAYALRKLVFKEQIKGKDKGIRLVFSIKGMVQRKLWSNFKKIHYFSLDKQEKNKVLYKKFIGMNKGILKKIIGDFGRTMHQIKISSNYSSYKEKKEIFAIRLLEKVTHSKLREMKTRIFTRFQYTINKFQDENKEKKLNLKPLIVTLNSFVKSRAFHTFKKLHNIFISNQPTKASKYEKGLTLLHSLQSSKAQLNKKDAFYTIILREHKEAFENQEKFLHFLRIFKKAYLLKLFAGFSCLKTHLNLGYLEFMISKQLFSQKKLEREQYIEILIEKIEKQNLSEAEILDFLKSSYENVPSYEAVQISKEEGNFSQKLQRKNSPSKVLRSKQNNKGDESEKNKEEIDFGFHGDRNKQKDRVLRKNKKGENDENKENPEKEKENFDDVENYNDKENAYDNDYNDKNQEFFKDEELNDFYENDPNEKQDNDEFDNENENDDENNVQEYEYDPANRSKKKDRSLRNNRKFKEENENFEDQENSQDNHLQRENDLYEGEGTNEVVPNKLNDKKSKKINEDFNNDNNSDEEDNNQNYLNGNEDDYMNENEKGLHENYEETNEDHEEYGEINEKDEEVDDNDEEFNRNEENDREINKNNEEFNDNNEEFDLKDEEIYDNDKEIHENDEVPIEDKQNNKKDSDDFSEIIPIKNHKDSLEQHKRKSKGKFNQKEQYDIKVGNNDENEDQNEDLNVRNEDNQAFEFNKEEAEDFPKNKMNNEKFVKSGSNKERPVELGNLKENNKKIKEEPAIKKGKTLQKDKDEQPLQKDTPSLNSAELNAKYDLKQPFIAKKTAQKLPENQDFEEEKLSKQKEPTEENQTALLYSEIPSQKTTGDKKSSVKSQDFPRKSSGISQYFPNPTPIPKFSEENPWNDNEEDLFSKDQNDDENQEILDKSQAGKASQPNFPTHQKPLLVNQRETKNDSTDKPNSMKKKDNGEGKTNDPNLQNNKKSGKSQLLEGKTKPVGGTQLNSLQKTSESELEEGENNEENQDYKENLKDKSLSLKSNENKEALLNKKGNPAGIPQKHANEKPGNANEKASKLSKPANIMEAKEKYKPNSQNEEFLEPKIDQEFPSDQDFEITHKKSLSKELMKEPKKAGVEKGQKINPIENRGNPIEKKQEENTKEHQKQKIPTIIDNNLKGKQPVKPTNSQNSGPNKSNTNNSPHNREKEPTLNEDNEELVFNQGNKKDKNKKKPRVSKKESDENSLPKESEIKNRIDLSQNIVKDFEDAENEGELTFKNLLEPDQSNLNNDIEIKENEIADKKNKKDSQIPLKNQVVKEAPRKVQGSKTEAPNLFEDKNMGTAGGNTEPNNKKSKPILEEKNQHSSDIQKTFEKKMPQKPLAKTNTAEINTTKPNLPGKNEKIEPNVENKKPEEFGENEFPFENKKSRENKPLRSKNDPKNENDEIQPQIEPKLAANEQKKENKPKKSEEKVDPIKKISQNKVKDDQPFKNQENPIEENADSPLKNQDNRNSKPLKSKNGQENPLEPPKTINESTQNKPTQSIPKKSKTSNLTENDGQNEIKKGGIPEKTKEFVNSKKKADEIEQSHSDHSEQNFEEEPLSEENIKNEKIKDDPAFKKGKTFQKEEEFPQEGKRKVSNNLKNDQERPNINKNEQKIENKPKKSEEKKVDPVKKNSQGNVKDDQPFRNQENPFEENVDSPFKKNQDRNNKPLKSKKGQENPSEPPNKINESTQYKPTKSIPKKSKTSNLSENDLQNDPKTDVQNKQKRHEIDQLTQSEQNFEEEPFTEEKADENYNVIGTGGEDEDIEEDLNRSDDDQREIKEETAFKKGNTFQKDEESPQEGKKGISNNLKKDQNEQKRENKPKKSEEKVPINKNSQNRVKDDQPFKSPFEENVDFSIKNQDNRNDKPLKNKKGQENPSEPPKTVNESNQNKNKPTKSIPKDQKSAELPEKIKQFVNSKQKTDENEQLPQKNDEISKGIQPQTTRVPPNKKGKNSDERGVDSFHPTKHKEPSNTNLKDSNENSEEFIQSEQNFEEEPLSDERNNEEFHQTVNNDEENDSGNQEDEDLNRGYGDDDERDLEFNQGEEAEEYQHNNNLESGKPMKSTTTNEKPVVFGIKEENGKIKGEQAFKKGKTFQKDQALPQEGKKSTSNNLKNDQEEPKIDRNEQKREIKPKKFEEKVDPVNINSQNKLKNDQPFKNQENPFLENVDSPFKNQDNRNGKPLKSKKGQENPSEPPKTTNESTQNKPIKPISKKTIDSQNDHKTEKIPEDPLSKHHNNDEGIEQPQKKPEKTNEGIQGQAIKPPSKSKTSSIPLSEAKNDKTNPKNAEDSGETLGISRNQRDNKPLKSKKGQEEHPQGSFEKANTQGIQAKSSPLKKSHTSHLAGIGRIPEELEENFENKDLNLQKHRNTDKKPLRNKNGPKDDDIQGVKKENPEENHQKPIEFSKEGAVANARFLQKTYSNSSKNPDFFNQTQRKGDFSSQNREESPQNERQKPVENSKELHPTKNSDKSIKAPLKKSSTSVSGQTDPHKNEEIPQNFEEDMRLSLQKQKNESHRALKSKKKPENPNESIAPHQRSLQTSQRGYEDPETMQRSIGNVDNDALKGSIKPNRNPLEKTELPMNSSTFKSSHNPMNLPRSMSYSTGPLYESQGNFLKNSGFRIRTENSDNPNVEDDGEEAPFNRAMEFSGNNLNEEYFGERPEFGKKAYIGKKEKDISMKEIQSHDYLMDASEYEQKGTVPLKYVETLSNSSINNDIVNPNQEGLVESKVLDNNKKNFSKKNPKQTSVLPQEKLEPKELNNLEIKQPIIQEQIFDKVSKFLHEELVPSGKKASYNPQNQDYLKIPDHYAPKSYVIPKSQPISKRKPFETIQEEEHLPSNRSNEWEKSNMYDSRPSYDENELLRKPSPNNYQSAYENLFYNSERNSMNRYYKLPNYQKPIVPSDDHASKDPILVSSFDQYGHIPCKSLRPLGYNEENEMPLGEQYREAPQKKGKKFESKLNKSEIVEGRGFGMKSFEPDQKKYKGSYRENRGNLTATAKKQELEELFEEILEQRCESLKRQKEKQLSSDFSHKYLEKNKEIREEYCEENCMNCEFCGKNYVKDDSFYKNILDTTDLVIPQKTLNAEFFGDEEMPDRTLDVDYLE